jgi:hypothetical protein
MLIAVHNRVNAPNRKIQTSIYPEKYRFMAIFLSGPQAIRSLIIANDMLYTILRVLSVLAAGIIAKGDQTELQSSSSAARRRASLSAAPAFDHVVRGSRFIQLARSIQASQGTPRKD